MFDKVLILEDGVWTATYPFVKDPEYFPNDKAFAERLLFESEKKAL